MNFFTDTFNFEETINNISKLCNSKLGVIAHYATINDVFDNINSYTIICSKCLIDFVVKI